MRSRNIPYIAKLDHLRFLAALLVCVYHFYHFKTGFYTGGKTTQVISKSPLSAVIIEGHTGVSLFLVLSGFIFAVIAGSREIDYTGFIRNRFLRIMPLYVTVIGVACLISGSTFSQLAASLTFTSGFVPGVDDIRITPHLWTIGLEFQFYLLFPFLIHFFKHYGLRYALQLIILLVGIRLMLWGLGGAINLKDIMYYSLLGRMDQFVIGMTAGLLYSSVTLASALPWLKRPWSPIIGVAITVSALWGFHKAGGFFKLGDNHFFWVIWTPLEGLMWAILILTYSLSTFELPRKISGALAFMGSLSFSLYVNHWFFVNTMPWQDWLPRLVSNNPLNALLTFLIVVFPALTLFSWLTYTVIERPFFELRRTYLKKSPSSLTSPSGT